MRQATCLAVALLLAAGAAPAAETGYPSKPIRFLVGFPPGGGNDTIAGDGERHKKAPPHP